MKRKVPLFLTAIAILSVALYALWSKGILGKEKPPADDHKGSTIWQLKPEGEGIPNFAQIQEFALDQEGQKLLFWADDTVKDIAFTRVEYHETKGFQEKELLYSLKTLAPDTAIRLTYYLPETIPNLKLGFTLKDGSRQEFLIAQSGEDGSILLIDPKA